MFYALPQHHLVEDLASTETNEGIVELRHLPVDKRGGFISVKVDVEGGTWDCSRISIEKLAHLKHRFDSEGVYSKRTVLERQLLLQASLTVQSKVSVIFGRATTQLPEKWKRMVVSTRVAFLRWTGWRWSQAVRLSSLSP
jgi:hypothetical protein